MTFFLRITEIIFHSKLQEGRSRWPSGLKCGPAAAGLMGLRVQIPLGFGCLSLVSVVCCHVTIPPPEECPTKGVIYCDHGQQYPSTSTMGR